LYARQFASLIASDSVPVHDRKIPLTFAAYAAQRFDRASNAIARRAGAAQPELRKRILRLIVWARISSLSAPAGEIFRCLAKHRTTVVVGLALDGSDLRRLDPTYRQPRRTRKTGMTHRATSASTVICTVTPKVRPKRKA